MKKVWQNDVSLCLGISVSVSTKLVPMWWSLQIERQETRTRLQAASCKYWNWTRHQAHCPVLGWDKLHHKWRFISVSYLAFYPFICCFPRFLANILDWIRSKINQPGSRIASEHHNMEISLSWFSGASTGHHHTGNCSNAVMGGHQLQHAVRWMCYAESKGDPHSCPWSMICYSN